MGGPVPLGFDAKDRKLLINEEEAAKVRQIFDLYIKLKSVRKLKVRIDQLGFVSKIRRYGKKLTGGKPLSRGNLYQMLHNSLYAGDVPHKGENYPGQHMPVIDRKTWDTVQKLLSANTRERGSPRNSQTKSLLTGLLFDETTEPLCPTYTNKKGRKYRYYVSKRLTHGHSDGGDGWRIPAKHIEEIVLNTVCDFLSDEKRLMDAFASKTFSSRQINQLTKGATSLSALLGAEAVESSSQLLGALIKRVSLCPTRVEIEISGPELLEQTIGENDRNLESVIDPIKIDALISMQQRGIETKLFIGSTMQSEPNEKLVKLIARSFKCWEELVYGEDMTVRELAKRFNVDEGDLSRFLALRFLSPRIIEELCSQNIAGQLAARVGREKYRIPLSWHSQKHLVNRNGRIETIHGKF